ncbi:39S ribosomal protein L23, mitochondrial [Elysia marginata]|uniref:39S ribosomal protein L23, mitochondrial n=1 Tax=Elysia marginata TaxID=1093978 RepID=A0AAV4FSW7_9GAST|nr:39S ribosomal protein L23, mitochondrial [Elysia marginata]
MTVLDDLDVDVSCYDHLVEHMAVVSDRGNVIVAGEDIKHPTKRYVQAREPDKRMAYIVLGEGQEFTFPDLFAEKLPPMEREMKEMRKMKREGQVERRQSWEREAVPPWFR